MQYEKYRLFFLILIFCFVISSFKEIENDSLKIKHVEFRQYDVLNTRLKSLLDSISNYISNCENFNDRNFCRLNFSKLNDSTNSIYIGLLYDIQNLNEIQGLYKSNKINYILYKSDNIIKNFKLDSSKQNIILKSSNLNYFYEIPEWMFYERRDSIYFYFGLNYQCF